MSHHAQHPRALRHAFGPCALVLTATGALGFYTCGRQQPTTRGVIEQASRERLVAFRSEEELLTYLRNMGDAQRRRYGSANPNAGKQDAADGGVGSGTTIDFSDESVSGSLPSPPPAAAEAPSPSPAPSRRARSDSRSTATTPGAGQSEQITSTQEQGIDEGDIVKARGDHLIVLRRGRLFSIGIAGGRLTSIDAVNAYPEGSRPASWYDEMLIHGDTIVVVGYSYHASGTEIGLFHVDAAGRISHRNTYYLKSNDYYSSRNYASRLMGNTLLFYMPYHTLQHEYGPSGVTFNPSLPSMRQFQNGAPMEDGWRTIVRATEVYRPIQRTHTPVLHTVVSCDLSTPQPTCHARGILGPYGRTFYVSQSAVYVWVADERRAPRRGAEADDDPAFDVQWNGAQAPSVLYRLPLDGSEPGALRAWGTPTDQFSFQERAGALNVLLRASGGGDMMWGGEVTNGDVGLLRVPVASITAGVANARREDYRDLPRPGLGHVFQNRFVGDHVLYGTGSSWGPPAPSDRRIYVHSIANRSTEPMALPGGTDRIEPMDEAAVVVGTDGRDLHFTSIRLDRGPTIVGSYVERNASQGETRSHGFFFRPDGDEDGMLGLPVRGGAGRPGYEQLFRGSAGVLFLRVDDLQFRLLGALGSQATENVRDQCVASCVDWYGNSRPIFYRNRVFALLGYELVEGRVDRRAIREVHRIDMSSAIRPAVAAPPN